MRKGQISSLDLFVALVVFLLLLSMTILTWSLYTKRLANDLDYEKAQHIAFQISDLLVKNPGYPTEWEDNPANLEVIGLAKEDRVISQDKVTAFVNLDYNSTRSNFKIKPYEYKFRIRDLANNVIKESGLNATGPTAVVVERYVLYENERTILEFTIWE